jgi:hypothetical protein
MINFGVLNLIYIVTTRCSRQYGEHKHVAAKHVLA